jgi:hypothetical protein
MKLSSAELKIIPEGRSTICDIVVVNDDPTGVAGKSEELIACMIRNIDYISPTLDIRVYSANPATFATTIEVQRKLFPWQSERQSTVIAGARVLIEFNLPATNSEKAKERIEQARSANVEVLIEAGSLLDNRANGDRIPSFSCGNGLLALLEHRLGRQRRFSFIGTSNHQPLPLPGPNRVQDLRDGLILALIGNGGTNLFMPFFEVYSREYLRSPRQLAVVGILEATFHNELFAELSRIGFPDVLLLGNTTELELKELYQKAFGVVILGNSDNLPYANHAHQNLRLISIDLPESERNMRYGEIFTNKFNTGR